MRFAEPVVFYLLLLVPLAGAVAWGASVARRRALRAFSGGAEAVSRFSGQVSVNRRAIRRLLLAVGALAGILAAARPQWGTRLEPITRKGIDVVVAVDTSRSMAATDAPPNRLGQAKHTAASLIRRLAGDRIAVVSFAGKATLNCPLTLDHEAALLFLDALDVETVVNPGTSIAEAARVALRAFGASDGPSRARSRVLVILSDGEDHEGGIESAISLLKKEGVIVYAVGCGTRRGAPVPLGDDRAGVSGYKKDREGRIVTTRLDDASLGKAALDTGGRYFDATPAEVEVEEIGRALASMDAREFGTLLRTRYEERFQIPLAATLICLLAATAIGERRRSAAAPKREEAP